MALSIDPLQFVSKVLEMSSKLSYEDAVRKLSLEYGKKVNEEAWVAVIRPKEIKCELVQQYLRKVALTALGVGLSSYFRRDAKYASQDLSDSWGLLKEWLTLRQEHGITTEHPSEFAYRGLLLSLQWDFAEAGDLFEKAAELNLERRNKYPALPNLFNAAYCYCHDRKYDKTEEALNKLEIAISILKEQDNWEQMYKTNSLTSFKEFDLELWQYLGWCDYYIHHPDWNSDESIKASFEAKWEHLISGRLNNTVITSDLAAAIFSDPHWAQNHRDVTEAIWNSICIDSAKNRIVRLARILNIMLDRRGLKSSLATSTAAAVLLAASAMVYSNVPTNTAVILALNDVYTVESYQHGGSQEIDDLSDASTAFIAEADPDIVEGEMAKRSAIMGAMEEAKNNDTTDVAALGNNLSVVGAADQDVDEA